MQTKNVLFATYDTNIDGLKIDLYLDNEAKQIKNLFIFKPRHTTKYGSTLEVFSDTLSFELAVYLFTIKSTVRFKNLIEFFKKELKNQ